MRIQEVAEKSGLSCHTLRYYEKQGLIYNVPRDASGHRYYREQDLHWIHFVQCLKKTGMPLKDIQNYAKIALDQEKRYDFLLEILVEHKTRLDAQKADIEECLEHVNWKINHYNTLL
ncbi:MerR family transcriptional regulator [Vibrio sonorensis]|uniref:MerR family transcriptional regulator n=1 Tax=Vibrio sonorensis TaxID=1004316 RepID=UPI0008D96BA6|nr:MerR family transcriptional regulator [Vibrio sonorensis]